METLYVLVKTEPGRLEEVYRAIESQAQVTEVTAVTGAFDLVVKVENESLPAALSFVVKELRKIDGVDKTETLVGLKLF